MKFLNYLICFHDKIYKMIYGLGNFNFITEIDRVKVGFDLQLGPFFVFLVTNYYLCVVLTKDYLEIIVSIKRGIFACIVCIVAFFSFWLDSNVSSCFSIPLMNTFTRNSSPGIGSLRLLKIVWFMIIPSMMLLHSGHSFNLSKQSLQ